jgi:general secretion pathway protein K
VTTRIARPRRGVALFTALWLVVVIGIVGLQFSLEARERRLAAANGVEIAQSRAAALAGVEHAQARLERLARRALLLPTGSAVLRSSDPWLGVDTLVRIDGDVRGARYEVRVRVAGSTLDPNRATEEQLRLLLTRLGFDYGVSDGLAQCIVDWRDPDDMHRNRGAEIDYYIAAGRMILPRDAPFQDVPELLHVMGMTQEIYDSIAPFLSIESTAQINVNTAPPAVLATLPGFSDATVAAIMRLREAGGRIAGLPDLRTLVGGDLTARNVTFDARSVIVTSTGWNQGGRTPYRIEAMIERGTNSTAPTNVRWRRSR